MPKRLAIFTASLLLGACSPVPVHPTTPLTVENFPHSADTGFYNGTLFRRVLPGCVIRGSSCTTIAPCPAARPVPSTKMHC